MQLQSFALEEPKPKMGALSSFAKLQQDFAAECFKDAPHAEKTVRDLQNFPYWLGWLVTWLPVLCFYALPWMNLEGLWTGSFSSSIMIFSWYVHDILQIFMIFSWYSPWIFLGFYHVFPSQKPHGHARQELKIPSELTAWLCRERPESVAPWLPSHRRWGRLCQWFGSKGWLQWWLIWWHNLFIIYL